MKKVTLQKPGKKDYIILVLQFLTSLKITATKLAQRHYFPLNNFAEFVKYHIIIMFI